MSAASNTAHPARSRPHRRAGKAAAGKPVPAKNRAASRRLASAAADAENRKAHAMLQEIRTNGEALSRRIKALLERLS